MLRSLFPRHNKQTAISIFGRIPLAKRTPAYGHFSTKTTTTAALSPPPQLATSHTAGLLDAVPDTLRRISIQRTQKQGRRLFTTTTGRMASDEDYMAFLDKANQDPSAGYTKTTSSSGSSPFRTTDEGVEIPSVLRGVARGGRKEAVYSSEADEPFEVVGLRLEGDQGGKKGVVVLPDEEQFAKMIGHSDPANAEIEILDPVDWDANGTYADVVEAVTQAGKGNDVRVYRVVRDGTRVEYWVVTTTGERGKGSLVGLKALAVES